jgi:YVTN family beta-propeller protein
MYSPSPRRLLFRQFTVLYLMVICSATCIAKGPPNKATSLVIITNWGSDSCSLIDIAANSGKGEEKAQIKVGMKPYDVKVDAKGRFAYVTCSGAAEIAIIDIQAMLALPERIKVGESPRDIDITSDGKRAVVANAGSDSISVVDLDKKKELYQLPVGPIPYGVALTNHDKLALITLWGSGKAVLAELSETGGKVVSTLAVGSLPYTAVAPEGSNYAAVSCFGSNEIVPIDLKNKKALPGLKVGRSPWGLANSADGKKLLTANFYSGDASLIKFGSPDPVGATAPLSEESRIDLTFNDPVGASNKIGRAKNVAFSADPNVAVLSDLSKNQILVLNIAEKKVTAAIPVGQAPYGVAFVPRQ